MKNVISILGFLVGAFLLVWLSYSAGYGSAFEEGIDRNMSTIHGNGKLQIQVLDLLSQGKSVRAVEVLNASVKSDLSLLKHYASIRKELTYMNILKSSLSSYGLNPSNTQILNDKVIEELEILHREIEVR